jgi:two-component system response regulator (stage 0 sporulation protein F)
MKRANDGNSGSQYERHVLVAEDDEELRELVMQTLRAEGFTVIGCPNGLSLVETLVSQLEGNRRPFDLVVSDVRLPGITGLSVLEGLSQWDELRGVPMVLMTAFGDPQLHALARRLGAVSLLEKPFEMTALVRVVRGAINGRDPQLPCA